MKIMITGATGFLGGKLSTFLSREHDVEPISLRDEDFHNKVIQFKPQIFIHCAWIGGSSYAETQDFKQYENISQGLDVLKALNCLDDTKFIGFGSFSEYGDRQEIISETHKEDPSSLYGLTKKMFKEISKSFCDMKGFSWLWVRPCYVYGPGDVSTRLIPKVIGHCLRKKKIVLNSCNSNVDYLYIDDFVDAINCLIEKEKQGVFNICSGEKYKVKDVVELIAKSCDFNNILYDKSKDRDNFPKIICGDRRKITSETGWHPKTNLLDGLKRSIESQK
jgi:nucleoside-diphosphate-sugar epimerase